MITEDYISFETAKLLKEKGFDEGCRRYWYKGNLVFSINEIWNRELDNYEDKGWTAPTLQMVMKWLREVHNILLVVDYDYEFTSTSYIYKIYRLVENGRPERVIVKGTSYDKDNNPTEHIVAVRDYERSAEEYATYQQAAEAGIKYCLESI